LGEYIEVPDYSSKSLFISAAKDIQLTIESIPEKYRPMVLFIDDLDRCFPDRVSSVVEAMNLFLGGGFLSDCVFVIGMDVEMVAAALKKSYSQLIDTGQNYSSSTDIGSLFLEKFVQLPFAIPPLEEADMANYVNNLFLRDNLQERNPTKIEEAAKEIRSNDELISPVTEKYNLNDDKGKAYLQNQKEQNQTLETLNAMIDKYTEEDPEIQEMISREVKQFLDNPRDVKRLMNVFRFQYFILLARKTKGMATPTKEQLIRWVILSLKWPDFARLLQFGSGGGSNMLESGKSTTRSGYLLMQLENFGRICKDQNEWESRLTSDLRLEPSSASWLNDQDLRNFFILEGKIGNEADRLSASAGTGFY
jgi:hypothetical protein